MGYFYTGQHRSDDPRPTCDCGVPTGTPWIDHLIKCAVVHETTARLGLTGGGAAESTYATGWRPVTVTT